MTRNSEQTTTPNVRTKEALNRSKLLKKVGHYVDVKVNYTCGNITIWYDTNLSQAWIDSLNKVFADSVLEWQIRDVSTGKP